MCQPSANKAIELNHQPAAISIAIVAAVSHATIQVLRSAAALPVSKMRLCVQGKRVSVRIDVWQEFRAVSLPYLDEGGTAVCMHRSRIQGNGDNKISIYTNSISTISSICNWRKQGVSNKLFELNTG